MKIIRGVGAWRGMRASVGVIKELKTGVIFYLPPKDVMFSAG